VDGFITRIADFVHADVTPLVVLALLPLDLLALALARRERRERLAHLSRVEDAARVYSRENYELLLMRNTRNAEKSIYCYWFSLHPSRAAAAYADFNHELIAAKNRKVNIQIVTARDPSRLAAASELNNKGIEIRFHDSLLVSDLRFTLIDKCTLIFGLSDGAPEAPSREGVDMVNQRKLSLLVWRHFMEQWDRAITFEDYLTELIRSSLNDDPGNTPEMIAQQLKMPLTEIVRRFPIID
jgi:hypothetical protein